MKTVTSGFTVNAAGTQITGVVVPAGAQNGPVTVSTPSGSSAGGTAATVFMRAATLAAGSRHLAAVRADGSLWAWGYNSYGQLGDGTRTNRNVPVRVGPPTGWVSVAAGEYHSVALRADGTIWAWGSINNSPTPMQVGTSTDWVSVATGAAHLLAVRADGTLWRLGQQRLRPARRRHPHHPQRAHAGGVGHRLGEYVRRLCQHRSRAGRWHALGLGQQQQRPAGRWYHHRPLPPRSGRHGYQLGERNGRRVLHRRDAGRRHALGLG